MPKKIVLFDQNSMPNKNGQELQDAVNEWFVGNPHAENVEIQLSGEEGNAMVMIFYKTTS